MQLGAGTSMTMKHTEKPKNHLWMKKKGLVKKTPLLVQGSNAKPSGSPGLARAGADKSSP